YHHIPVLLSEVLTVLNPEPGQLFVDATLGGGGYTTALLEHTAPEGRVLAFDLDQDAIDAFLSKIGDTSLASRVSVAHHNFSAVAHVAAERGFGPIAGIVADIGLSSYELDQAGRGISFQRDEPLDMRFDQASTEPTAAFLLAESSEAELARIFRDYGEERFAPSIAQNIVRTRSSEPIARTVQLVELIRQSLPGRLRHTAHDSARRVFQALRIAVNHELANLEAFLPAALDILAPGGVLAIVTFHSLEDRIVKQFFKTAATGCVCPPEFPVCRCGSTARVEILTKRPITAGEQEQEANRRSLSAKLRAVRKV
ncbi:MAG: 16S rRNA (cytosine(1402)-N(4))-methyltransferase RsmH, partial [Candidatus Doudnabacteria bacterium]|nr:16S rRNA (cytosine(1402)-N(4))-methyltransferase RsmH [Candidatus Doudnabacteria bacterium]